MQSQDYITFDWDFNWRRRVVSSITISSQELSAYLNTDRNPSTPYVPLYPWSPTTKQYVDQHDTIVSATAPSNPTEWMVWYDTTNDSLKAYNWTSWETEWTKMVVLEYWVSTWQNFLDAYNKNALVYCKVSSWSSWYRMAFMAYTAWSSTPTEVEFQYYRSRSSHSTAANQLDEVYVYKLTNAWVWTTTQRDTAAKAIAWTWIWLTFNSSGMTISADTTVLATKADIADFWWFKVVATLPATWETNIIYLLWPIWTWADKYEEWIYASSTWTKIWETSVDLSDLNTKTFYLSSTSDLTTAQAAYDWFKAGNGVILVYLPEVNSSWRNSGIYLPYSLSSTSSNVCSFVSIYNERNQAVAWDNKWWWIYKFQLYFSLSGSTVTSITRYGKSAIASFLATDKENRAYTPTDNYHPATKKYVDDSVSWAVSKWSTAPSSPTEWQLWYDTTNDVLKVYDWTNWNKVWVESNTKTFLLASDSDKATATEAYKWFSEWNYPIIMRWSATFVWPRLSGNNLVFTQTEPYYNTWNTTTSIQPRTITFMYDTSTEQVTQILYSIWWWIPVLQTNQNYSTPYTPQYPWSPATKKYVDDSVVEYNAWEWIEIWTIQDYSAMRWPCPEWFHVPTNSELQNIINIWNALSAWSTPAQCESILNLTDHNKINWQGWYIIGLNWAFIWSCTPNNSWQSYAFSTAANQIQVRSSESRNNWYQIRPFKDKPVIPDNTRTTLFDWSSTAAWAWIFSNSLLWLISLSSDWENRTTIAIKNLWAPDTTSAWYYYQRWNNNWFVANWYTTSETTVNASNYWPMNYYNSNVFIMWNNWVWDNSNNRNLRWWVTWVVTIDNAITNTGVLSVNGQTGDVTINAWEASSIATTQPSNPVEWDVYYDTTNDVVKVYDWTNWNVTGKEYTAGEWIAIGTVHSDMRWPCPEWFHVPLSSELEALCEVVTTDLWLDSDGITMGTYLKMPIAGCRTTDSSIKNVGMYAYYWTATAHSVDNVEYIIFSSDSLFYHDWAYRASAFSIRWFRDSPVIPDNSWTTLYDWSSVQNGAWIFWNPSSWLISASSDWQNWITIQDKNLWATAVYNYWDTLSEANCGKFYQWGNNYWFSRTWTVTTSATQVDASNYWPWNYYSSDTFITRSASLYDWSSVQNDNLWWWETQWTWMSDEWNSIINTGVLSVNWQTWAVTVNSDVKVFEVPAVNDDISDMVTRLSAWKWVILHEMVSWTDAFYKVDYHDDVNCEITASLIYSYNGGYARVYTIEYNYSTKRVITKTPSLIYFWWIQLAPNSKYNVKYHRYWPETDYDNLSQYYTDNPKDTAYFTTDE